jgi:hypothetical protein
VVTVYPASGYRDASSAAIAGTGSGGFAWCFARSGTYAYCLRFTSTEVGPSTSGHRAYGFPIRCVQYLLLSL